MNQARSTIVTGKTGTTSRGKETTLALEIDKVLNEALEANGELFKSFTITPLGSAMPDSVLVTVLIEADAKPKTKK